MKQLYRYHPKPMKKFYSMTLFIAIAFSVSAQNATLKVKKEKVEYDSITPVNQSDLAKIPVKPLVRPSIPAPKGGVEVFEVWHDKPAPAKPVIYPSNSDELQKQKNGDNKPK